MAMVGPDELGQEYAAMRRIQRAMASLEELPDHAMRARVKRWVAENYFPSEAGAATPAVEPPPGGSS